MPEALLGGKAEPTTVAVRVVVRGGAAAATRHFVKGPPLPLQVYGSGVSLFLQPKEDSIWRAKLEICCRAHSGF
jgi:hypothetical protein